MVLLGLLMVINKLSIVGLDYYTKLGNVTSGYFLIIIGIVIVAVGYYSLSPFGKIRKFFEEGKPKRKR